MFLATAFSSFLFITVQFMLFLATKFSGLLLKTICLFHLSNNGFWFLLDLVLQKVKKVRRKQQQINDDALVSPLISSVW